MDVNHVNQNKQLNAVNQSSDKNSGLVSSAGPRWLVEERDACGVGFIANRDNQASHELIVKALSALTCLEHRGGCSADKDSGDGAGLMTAIPWELLSQWLAEQGVQMPPTENCGVGMVFLPQEAQAATTARQIVEQVLVKEGLTVLGWREVPVQSNLLGVQARENQPQISQVLVAHPTLRGDELERQFYITRKRIGKELENRSDLNLNWSEDFYICSFSNRTIVYKGMVRSYCARRRLYRFKEPSLQECFCYLSQTL